uniref:BHLH domain-containing protein n=1 Tax=Oryzias sinensis TaxID=183150 RepID=A0A8C7WXK4_9TELE
MEPTSIPTTTPFFGQPRFNPRDTCFYQELISEPLHPASLLHPAAPVFSDGHSLAWGSDAGGSAPILSSSSSSYVLRPRQPVKSEDEGQNLANLRTQSENSSRLETERLRDTYEKLKRFTSVDPRQKLSKTDILLNVLSFVQGRSFPWSSDALGSAAISSSSCLPQLAKAEADKGQRLAHRRRQMADRNRRDRAKLRDTLDKLRQCTTFDPHYKMTKMDILLNAVNYGNMSASAQPAISEGSSFMWNYDAGDSAAWGGPHPEAVQDGTTGPAFAQPTFSDCFSYCT